MTTAPDRFYTQKLRRLIFCLLAFITGSSCTFAQTSDIESHIGLYEIIDSKCELPKADFDPCKNTLFFELLKGQFIGIEDSELTYVFWSGDPNLDPELQYTSHRMSNDQSTRKSADKFWLSNDNETKEYLLFSEGKLIGYHAEYNSADKTMHRVIDYKLKPVQRGNLPSVRLNYPGNR